MNEKPSYYSILTADVRYNENLSDSEKVLYSEITALSNKYGYCTAGNAFLADLYGISIRSVQRRISNLQKHGAVHVEMVMDGGEVVGRKIYPISSSDKVVMPRDKSVMTSHDKSDTTPHDKNVTHNTTRDLNTTSNNTNKDIVDSIDSVAEKANEIIDHLNQVSGKSFRASSQKTKSLINARLKEGFEVEDFKTVIDKKVRDWRRDSKMEKYIRPITLFGTKFESYLNEGGVRSGRERIHKEPKKAGARGFDW